MSSENIKVVVRVRPFSKRELDRCSQCIVKMQNNATYLTNPANKSQPPRKFIFDHSYWSHDGYEQDANGHFISNSDNYITQERVFHDLGQGMLDNAWQGYNCSVFAYGQTSSGKSYSIMGHAPNSGLVPRTCEQLFSDINKKKNSHFTFEVTFSMLEIYNEHVRDLIASPHSRGQSLKVKESPEKGFYVEGLSVIPVDNTADVRLRVLQGDRGRTIAATKMNECSSRAHTIVTLTFAQNDLRRRRTTVSTVTLVDLAGSERVKQTEATGDRFKEAKNINKSLMSLGSVIKALCDCSKGHSPHVPYRDSMLTKLMKNTLGGNSKSVMLAAISPDAENYEQTLSTLRYADRAKSIKTVAKVNEQETNKLIKDLINEKELLLKELQSMKMHNKNSEEIARLKKEQELEIARYREQMEDIELSWQKRLEDAKHEMDDLRAFEVKEKDNLTRSPHLSNLNVDSALQGKLIYTLENERTTFGNGRSESPTTHILNGLKISKNHAIIINDRGHLRLVPAEGEILYNGKQLDCEVKLKHQDRIRFGSNSLFVFKSPQGVNCKSSEVTFEFAQAEITRHSGICVDMDDALLQQEVMTVMQMVSDVNAMADLLRPHSVKFSTLLVSPEARGLCQATGRTEVFVELLDLTSDNEFLWTKNQFLNRQVHMQEMYENFVRDPQSIDNIEKENDPFCELAETDILIGIASLPLNYLAHMVDFQDDPLTIIDFKAKQVGFLDVALLPSTQNQLTLQAGCIENPLDLINNDIECTLKVDKALNLSSRVKQSWIKYKFYKDCEYTCSQVSDGKNPKYNCTRIIDIPKHEVNMKFLDYLLERGLLIEIWGRQQCIPKQDPKQSHHDTSERIRQSLDSNDLEKVQNECSFWKQKANKLQSKLDQIEVLVMNKQGKSQTVEKIKSIIFD